MPIEIVLKACYALQEVGKAEVFYSDSADALGVKIFHHGWVFNQWIIKS